MSLRVQIVPSLKDNYIFLLAAAPSPGGDNAPVPVPVAVIDPGDADAAIKALENRGLVPTHVFNTHHHSDHTAGNQALKARYGAVVIGPRADQARIPELDQLVGDGDTFMFGNHRVEVIETPGHTLGHISFWLPDDQKLFCGDTLFAMGCGRLFEGTPEQMWTSLSRLRDLPPETQVYCAHEYTLSNARFARGVDPDNPALAERVRLVEGLRSRNLPTIPSTIAEERATNPFLRADDPGFQARLGLTGQPASAVFAELRRRKDAA